MKFNSSLYKAKSLISTIQGLVKIKFQETQKDALNKLKEIVNSCFDSFN